MKRGRSEQFNLDIIDTSVDLAKETEGASPVLDIDCILALLQYSSLYDIRSFLCSCKRLNQVIKSNDALWEPRIDFVRCHFELSRIFSCLTLPYLVTLTALLFALILDQVPWTTISISRYDGKIEARVYLNLSQSEIDRGRRL